MKRTIAALLVMMACIVCISCSQDDEDSGDKNVKKSVKEMIVGTWEVSYQSKKYPDIITFNGVNMYFQATCYSSKGNQHVYNGEYSVVENVINLKESTRKYPLDVIVIKEITSSYFVGQCDYIGEVKGTKRN